MKDTSISKKSATAELGDDSQVSQPESRAKTEVEASKEAGLGNQALADNTTTHNSGERSLPTMPTHNTADTPSRDITTTNKEDAEDTNTSVKEGSLAKSVGPATKKFITIRHNDGKSFMVPWDQCRTLEGFENLVKVTFQTKNTAKKEIDEGNYKILREDKEVMRDWWGLLVKPKWDVTIRLHSQKTADIPRRRLVRPEMDSDEYSVESETDTDESSAGSETDNDAAGKKHDMNGNKTIGTNYLTKIGHAITYESGSSFHPTFLCTISCDDDFELKPSVFKHQELPIIEEITTVRVPNYDSKKYRPAKLKGKPKFGVDDKIKNTVLHIRSPYLLNAIRSVIRYSATNPSGDREDTLRNGRFVSPYADLFYNKQELSDYVKSTAGPRQIHSEEYNTECDRHINFLLEYLEKEPNVQLTSLEAMWAKKTPTTTFAGLWLLMKPGSDVYVQEDGQLNAFVVDTVSGGVIRRFESAIFSPYKIQVWRLIYNGKVITRQTKSIVVALFDSEMEILSLPLFPTRFIDTKDGGVRRKQLIERGKKVFRLAKGPSFMEFTGIGLKPNWKQYDRARVVIEHQSQPWTRPEFEYLVGWNLKGDDEDPRVVLAERHYMLGIGPPPPVDSKVKSTIIGKGARAPRCECVDCKRDDTAKEKYILPAFADYDDIDPHTKDELSDHQYLLCMSHMFGFVLKDRTYDHFDVSNLTNVQFVDRAIDRLVMRPESSKETIKSIVQTYTEGDQDNYGHFSADFIRGKGEGQIFLLHGPPGTGKTLTAESVAEYTKRPLLSITAADLGHEAPTLEKNLLRFFDDDTSWDAIVLLDEADVFLERRSSNDIQRNSIVSVFLRAMDYFQGILFLTTNRIGHFDEAIMSRIHLAIGYEPLDDESRRKIWDNLFQKLKDDHKTGGSEIRYDYDAKEYVKKNEEIKNLQWNGREIRNAFQTAVALAVHDAKRAAQNGASGEDLIPEVKESHLAQVVRMSAAFKDYIISTHEGIDDEDLAYRLGNRDDKKRYGDSQK